MSEKAVLTQSQALMMETLRANVENDFLQFQKHPERYDKSMKVLYDLPLDTYKLALAGEYVIQGEVQEGDWVVIDAENIYYITQLALINQGKVFTEDGDEFERQKVTIRPASSEEIIQRDEANTMNYITEKKERYKMVLESLLQQEKLSNTATYRIMNVLEVEDYER